MAGLFVAAALANPIDEKGLNCQALDDIITIMHAQRVATPFCSTVLQIPTITQTSTCTSTPKLVTVKKTVDVTDTVTAFTTTTFYGTTTVYPVVAISTTSTCALGATIVPTTTTAATTTAAAPTKKAKRAAQGWPQTTTAIGTPTCLGNYKGSALTSACSCLNIPTPTSVVITTTTLPTSTITKVIAGTCSVTVTSTISTTSFTSTYSATQFFTSTFTVLPAPTSTVTLPDGEVYGVYNNLDFAGQDIQNFFCYKNGPSAPAPFQPSCQSFNDCVSECGYYNDQKLGASQNLTCGAVVYNAPADGSSGSCYLKTGQTGCGSTNSLVNTGVLLPLIPNDVQ
ncbi:hypothetical protein LTR86_005915 [Recurvomyces mirabilis]|nr:hypothetical protein LTR86_005915 [Recurvomyces mirabilis]